MALEQMPEKPELMITSGFSATPATLDKLRDLSDHYSRSRSAVLRHLIESAHTAVQKGKK